jgi:hypothetical protein
MGKKTKKKIERSSKERTLQSVTPTFSCYVADFNGVGRDLRKKGIPFTSFYEECFTALPDENKCRKGIYCKPTSLIGAGWSLAPRSRR